MAPYALKKIGLESYGLWALLSTLTRYVLLADWGIGSSITRHVAQYLEHGNALAIRTATTIGTLYYVCFSIPIMALAVFVAPRYLGTLHLSGAIAASAEPDLLLFALASLTTFIIWMSQSATLSGRGKFSTCAMINAIGSLVYTGAAFILLWLGFGIKAMIFATLIQGISSGILGHIILLRMQGAIYTWPWRIERKILIDILTFGAWSQIGTLANLVIYDSPALIVGSILGLSAVGVLDIGTRLARAIRAIAFNFTGALLPAISSRHALAGSDGVLSILPHLLRTAALIAFSATGLLVASSPLVLPLWIGTHVVDLHMVEIVIAGISVTYTIEMLVSVLVTAVRGSGMPWLEAWFTLTYSIPNLILLFVLTPHFGLVGVVAAPLMSVLLAALTFITRCYFEKALPLTLWTNENWLIKTCVSWAVSTGAIFFASTMVRHATHNRFGDLAALFVLMGLFVICELGLLVLLRALTSEDAQRLRALLPERLVRFSG